MTTDTMTIRFDLESAERLKPLLQGIAMEIHERSREVRKIRHRLAKLSGPEQELPTEPAERAETLELRARLATQLRERRNSLEELEELGCFLDETDGSVRIPGPSGTLEDGFLWNWLDGAIHPVPNVNPEPTGA